MRRRAWQDREVPLDADGWPRIADRVATPEDAETRELLACGAARDRRRADAAPAPVLVAIALDDVPIDVLAERLDTTRGALYKTLHDARRKLARSPRGSTPEGDGTMTDDRAASRGCSARPSPRSPARRASRSSTATSSPSSAGEDADPVVPGMDAHLRGLPGLPRGPREPRRMAGVA